ncbi:hypothetical protein HMPREF1403_01359 [Helicobacter pylori GAM201Ai]|nr:hypothetical protein HMPREF1403_01359 [Helicobacter pylori GAM201Ai]
MSRGLSSNKSLKRSFSRLYSSLSLSSVSYWLGLSLFKTTAFLKSLDFKLFGFFYGNDW